MGHCLSVIFIHCLSAGCSKSVKHLGDHDAVVCHQVAGYVLHFRLIT